MANKIIIKPHRDVYNINEVKHTMTVGQLISFLKRFNTEANLYVSHDGGYMYSGVYEDDFLESF